MRGAPPADFKVLIVAAGSAAFGPHRMILSTSLNVRCWRPFWPIFSTFQVLIQKNNSSFWPMRLPRFSFAELFICIAANICLTIAGITMAITGLWYTVLICTKQLDNKEFPRMCKLTLRCLRAFTLICAIAGTFRLHTNSDHFPVCRLFNVYTVYSLACLLSFFAPAFLALGCAFRLLTLLWLIFLRKLLLKSLFRTWEANRAGVGASLEWRRLSMPKFEVNCSRSRSPLKLIPNWFKHECNGRWKRTTGVFHVCGYSIWPYVVYSIYPSFSTSS